MAPTRKTTIDANGIVLTEDENGNLIDDTTSSSSSSSSRSSIIPRIPSRIDIFGFLITPKQFLIVLLIAAIMLGRDGFVLFLLIFAAYHLFVFISGSRSSSNKFGGTGRSFGANIHGMKDLPKPPPSGG